jgi:hypothetical protein
MNGLPFSWDSDRIVFGACGKENIPDNVSSVPIDASSPVLVLSISCITIYPHLFELLL